MFSFRLMECEDADAVAKVEEASFARPWSRKDFWEQAQNEWSAFLLLLKDETVIGYGGLWFVLDEAQVMNVAILPEYRGKGLSKKLMEKLLVLAKGKGAERMTLEVRPSNTSALALYKSFDFVDCGRRPGYYLDNGEDAIIMWNLDIGKTVKERCLA